MLSNTCQYAVRAVIYLAINAKDKKIGIKQISRDLDIPSPFLGKILQTLAKHKLLFSTKGPHGGFALGKNADVITIFDIVEVIDGLDIFNNCLFGLSVCKNDETLRNICPIHPASGPIREELLGLFKKQRIKDLAEGFGKVDKTLYF